MAEDIAFAVELKKISGLRQIVDLYDGFLIDLWGVVHDGHHPHPGAVSCLNTLIEKGKKIIFLSNAPRPSSLLLKKLLDLGINATEEMIYTSGNLTRYQLKHFEDPFFQGLGSKFYHLGAERNTDILAGLDLDVRTSLNDADILLISGYIDEEEPLDLYDDKLKLALELKLPAICANPDTTIIAEGKYRYCAGVTAEKYESMGGVVHYYGKPFKMIYEFAFKIFQENGIRDKKRILAIGDTFETDILGAANFGCASALVATGNVSRLVSEETARRLQIGDSDPVTFSDLLPDLVHKYGVCPNLFLPGLIY